MKLRQLEISLQQVSGFSNPNAALEQYITPSDLAARFLHDAYMHGDIEGLRVLDLGCGTGMLSAGAALLGADVTGVDCDASALSVAQKNAELFGLSISFQRAVIPSSFGEFDTVIMNPPFGAQNEHADRPFIETALSSAPVVWGIFNKGTIPFLKAYTNESAEITDMVSAKLNIPKQFFFHTKENLEIPVEIVRMVRK
ncbi:MAG TPA: METTL5 family protein [Methanocorpusculum sp.]|nr:METTL5 family protein [Methanocorpusculum sp.]